MVYFTEARGKPWETLGAEVDPLTMRLTPEQRKRLPLPRYRGSMIRQLRPSREIENNVKGNFSYSISGVKGLYRERRLDHPVKLALDIMADYALIVPGVFFDQPLHLRPNPGERYIYDQKGAVIYDRELQNAMDKRNGKKGRRAHGMKNPAWGVYPDIPKRFDPFPKGHHPTTDEKFERVMAFLEIYAECGHIMAAGKAVGSTFYQLLIWANEDPVLMEQVAIAEASVRMLIRSTATHMAYQGNEKMITLLMKEEAERRKEVKKSGSTTLEVSDEVTEVISITQRAAAKLAERALQESNAESFQADFVDEIQTVEIDPHYRSESN